MPEGWVADRNTFLDANGAEVKAFSLKHALSLGILLKLRDPSKDFGTLLNPPPVKCVRVEHTGVRPEQHFSVDLVDGGVRDGWISLSKGELTLHTVDEQDDLVYALKRTPGWYCCHCKQPLENANVVPEGSKVSLGTRHVQETHLGKESPDASNPSGYERLNYYDCVLNEKQHALFKSSVPTLDLLKKAGG